MEKPRVIIVMGVAGSGKTTVGELLASRNGGKFHDADNFHPDANIEKMAAGIPLDDVDRAPWLARLRTEVVDATPESCLAVIACSALKKSYRAALGVGGDGVTLVYLKGDAPTLSLRLENRAGHFMKAGMLESQLRTLEEPEAAEGFTADIGLPLDEAVMSIEEALGF